MPIKEAFGNHLHSRFARPHREGGFHVTPVERRQTLHQSFRLSHPEGAPNDLIGEKGLAERAWTRWIAHGRNI
jgi:hypothetical protein